MNEFQQNKNQEFISLPEFTIKNISFSLDSYDSILKVSVIPEGIQKEYNSNKDIEIANTPFDPRLGCSDKYEHQCATCDQKISICPGHPGHINFTIGCKEITSETLPEEKIYVYNPSQTSNIVNLMSSLCPNLMCESVIRTVILQDSSFKEKIVKIPRKQRLAYIHEFTKTKTSCSVCKKVPNDYDKQSMTKFFQMKKIVNKETSSLPDLPYQIYEHFDRITDQEAILLGFDFVRNKENRLISHPRNFIILAQFVIPPCLRPTTRSENRPPELHSFTRSYNDMIKILSKPKVIQSERIMELQSAVNVLFQNKEKKTINNTSKLYTSVSEYIQSRDGMVRNECLGKRVNFAGRTVIGPGPNLRFGEVGIPEKIAKVLTRPETVTQQNLLYIENLLLNNKLNYHIPIKGPHAGSKVEITPKYAYGLLFEPGDVVYRQIQDNDIVIFNRQPTLHKFSMMAGRAKIIKENIIRIPLPYTKAFNADFDGDEMNIHVPQTKEAIFEAETYMNISKNLLSDQTNSPAYGQVLDTVLGSFLLLKSQVPVDLIEKCNEELSEPQNLEEFYSRLDKYNVPKTDGRALFSLLFPKDFTFVSDKVAIFSGIITTDNITKKEIGVSQGSLLQEIRAKYGDQRGVDFLTDNYVIIDIYNTYRGFSISFDDIPMPGSKPEKLIKSIRQYLDPVNKKKLLDLVDMCKLSVNSPESLEKLNKVKDTTDNELPAIFESIIDDFMTLEEYKNKKFQELRSRVSNFDNQSNTEVDSKLYERKINGTLNNLGNYIRKFQEGFIQSSNSLLAMVNSGSKGDRDNINKIIGGLGQQNFKGERLQGTMFGNRVTPYDLPDDPDPEAKGFCKRALLEGLTPKELFSHVSASREGLTDIAIGTAQTGYVQRRMMRGLQDISVDSQGLVTNAGKKIVQFMYGEDGFEPTIFVNSDFGTTQLVDIKKLFGRLNNE